MTLSEHVRALGVTETSRGTLEQGVVDPRTRAHLAASLFETSRQILRVHDNLAVRRTVGNVDAALCQKRFGLAVGQRRGEMPARTPIRMISFGKCWFRVLIIASADTAELSSTVLKTSKPAGCDETSD